MITDKGLYIIYLISAFCFIFAIKGLTSPKTAQTGNNIAISGMTLSVFITLFILPSNNDVGILLAVMLAALSGIIWANKIKMTVLPQMIALLNGMGGLSSVLVGFAEILNRNDHLFDASLGIVIGTLAFSGSLIAFLKLRDIGKFKKNAYFKIFNLIFLTALISVWFIFAHTSTLLFAYILIALAFLFGLTITMPIGGADMPIVISILNALSGFAAVGIGFSLSNIALIITGSLVGTSGTILAILMTKAMNKSLFSILFKPSDNPPSQQLFETTPQTASPQDAAFLMKNANKIIIVPGYGMAASGAQYALESMASVLKNKYHVNVKFAIHPVAGRMPGHMNVLLAEAKVEYNDVFSLEEINPDFESADVAYVIGANDITNPAAINDSSSPLYGMPILEVSKAKTVFFVKRSLNAGYSGAQNELFFAPNTLMLYGDAKKITEQIVGLL